MTTYRPSASVRLTLRLEEFADTAALNALLPADDAEVTAPTTGAPRATSAETDDSNETALARNQERRRALQARRSTMAPEEYQEQLGELIYEEQDILEAARQSEAAEQGTAPGAVDGTPPDDLTVIGSIFPSSVSIERNGLAKADTATIEIPFIDAPIDPRIVRSAHVQVAVGVIPAEEFEAGMSQANSRREDGRTLRSVVQPGDPGATEFLGFIDTWTTDYTGAVDMLKFECRDMSANIRDRKLSQDETIDLTLPIDQGVTEFLNRLGPITRGIEVVYEGEGDAPSPGDAFPARRRTRRGARARRGRASGSDMTAWDHITDVVRALGFLPVMKGFRLHIVEPRTLYSTEGVKRMVWGRNLQTLSFTRSLLGVQVPTIEVRSYDPDRGRTIWARYPVASGQRTSGTLGLDPQPRRTRANRVPPSGATPDENIRVMSVSSVTDPAVLERIARNAFEQLGRQEITGSLATKNAWSYDEEPDVADLLRVDAGEGIEILMVQANESDEATEELGENATLAEIMAMNRARRRDYFMALGFDEQVATRFAALQDATGFQTTFRVQTATIKYTADSGLDVGVDFVNYITVREEGAAS